MTVRIGERGGMCELSTGVMVTYPVPNDRCNGTVGVCGPSIDVTLPTQPVEADFLDRFAANRSRWAGVAN